MLIACKKLLSLLLVSVMVCLPLRAVTAMEIHLPLEGSDVLSVAAAVSTADSHAEATHCHGSSSASGDANTAQLDGTAASQPQDMPSNCQCCNGCDGECNGCTSLQAITLESFYMSASSSPVFISQVAPVFLNRAIQPLARPPLPISM